MSEEKDEVQKIEVTANHLYLYTTDSNGKQDVIEFPPRIPELIKSLKFTKEKFGKPFIESVIKVCGYVPTRNKDGAVILHEQVLAHGPPDAVVKQLEDLCMSKEDLSREIVRNLTLMSRNSGLLAVSITYLVEEGDVALTGGHTVLLSDSISSPEMNQLYVSVKNHADEIKDQAKQMGFDLEEQDGPRIIKPGDAAFRPPRRG